jgi:hypothetical protein
MIAGEEKIANLVNVGPVIMPRKKTSWNICAGDGTQRSICLVA